MMNYILNGIEMAEAKAMLHKVIADAKAPEDGYIAHSTEGHIADGKEAFTNDISHRYGHINRYCSGVYVTYIINRYRATSRKWGTLESGKTNALNQPIPRCEITKKIMNDGRACSIMIRLDY